MFSVTLSSKSDVDYLGQSTKGDLNLKLEHFEAFGKNYIFFFVLLGFSVLFSLFSYHVLNVFFAAPLQGILSLNISVSSASQLAFLFL